MLLTDLVVHECVESLPVALYLGGDVLILEDHTSCSALPPLCWKMQSIMNVWHTAFWRMFVSQMPDSYILSNVHRLSCAVPLRSCCLCVLCKFLLRDCKISCVAAKMSPRQISTWQLKWFCEQNTNDTVSSQGFKLPKATRRNWSSVNP